MIVGIDEVGRGCMAGPLVAAAVILGRPIAGLKDSKKLTRVQRVILDSKIRKKAVAFGIGWVMQDELDTVGMTQAIRLAMDRALDAINCEYDQIIIDGNYNFLQHVPKTETMVKADDKVQAVSAASIIAKVARDNWMIEAATRYPGYGFEKHVGYCTPLHRAAVQELGVCDLHRKTFQPVRLALGLVPDVAELAS